MEASCLDPVLLCHLLSVWLGFFQVSVSSSVRWRWELCLSQKAVMGIQSVSTFKALEHNVWNMLNIMYLLSHCCYITAQYHQRPTSFTGNHSWGNGQRKTCQLHFIQISLAGKVTCWQLGNCQIFVPLMLHVKKPIRPGGLRKVINKMIALSFFNVSNPK
jgi:hypothetical protein